MELASLGRELQFCCAAEKTSIRRSWNLVAPITETVADLLYRRLFEVAPQYRALFKEDLGPQKRKLLAMLHFVVRSLDWREDDWQESIAAAYQVVGDALLWTFDHGPGEADEVTNRSGLRRPSARPSREGSARR